MKKEEIEFNDGIWKMILAVAAAFITLIICLYLNSCDPLDEPNEIEKKY